MILRVITTLTACAAVSLSYASGVKPNEEFTAAANNYFKTTQAPIHFKQGVISGLQNTLTGGRPSPEYSALAAELANEYFPWAPLQQKYLSIMQSSLSTDDLKQAIAFFKSEAGQKMVNLEPKLNMASVNYIQKALRTHTRDIEQSINQIQYKTLRKQADSTKASALTQATLGEVYLKGIGTQPNPEKAVPWLKIAAKRGNPMAQAELAKMYDKGIGVKRNPTRAVIWYHKAASQGDANAMYQIARHFSDGNGVPKDNEKAAQWFMDAAMRSNICAKYATGMNYLNGTGVKPDKALAKAWLSSFAEVAYFTLNPQSGLKKVYDISKVYADFEVEDHGDQKLLDQPDISKDQAQAVSLLQQRAHKICV